MSSGADLFVVCKQCGSEVSPYITECPYCGHRLRRRAPKLPRESISGDAERGVVRRARRLRLGGASRTRSLTGPRRRLTRWPVESSAAISPPYVTIGLIALSCGLWIAWRGASVGLDKLAVAGPLHGDWWKLFSSQFAYNNGLYAFAALLTVAIFGWLLERRLGRAAVLALFLGSGVGGALAASAAYSHAMVIGGNGAALGLLAAWAAPDLRAARARTYYEGDLLGAGALAAILLAVPFVLPRTGLIVHERLIVGQPSWLAGVTGGAIGLVLGLGLQRGRAGEP
jgi:membrane associated rhomboid family serine protease